MEKEMNPFKLSAMAWFAFCIFPIKRFVLANSRQTETFANMLFQAKDAV